MVEVDTSKMTFGVFLEKVVKKSMGVHLPTLITDGGFDYEEGAWVPREPFIGWIMRTESQALARLEPFYLMRLHLTP